MKYAIAMLLFTCATLVHSVPESTATPRLIYETFWNLPELSSGQCDTVLELAHAHAPTNQSVWAILIVESSNAVNAEIYYTPDHVAGRISKGSMVRLNSMLTSLRRSVRKPERYCCIAESAFSPFIPTADQLPFIVQGELSDMDLIAVFDAWRAANAENTSSTEPRSSDLRRHERRYSNAPIRRITVGDDKTVRLQTALSRMPLAGRGASFIFKKENGKWIVVRQGRWLS